MLATPLSDFLYTLADPANLARFRADPREYCRMAGLEQQHTDAVLEMQGGLLRVLALKELEQAGLAPAVTDKLPASSAGSPEINIYPENTTTTNNFPNIHTIEVTYPSNYTTEYNVAVTQTQILSPDQPSEEQRGQSPFSVRDRILGSIDAAIAYAERTDHAHPGSLMIVGSGIRSIVDLTRGAEAQIAVANRVFYTVADPVTEKRIHDLNAASVSLYDLYENGKPRIETYRAMVDKMLAPVREGLSVCGVFYGHPGVFAWPTHEAIRLARLEGYRAEMMPGVSADACLFADLGIDPSHVGYQTFEATELLINQRRIDPASHVVIWQVECVGDGGFDFRGYRRHNFGVLVEYLQRFYTRDHEVIVYEASMYPHLRSIVKKLTLGTISKDDLTGISSLYIPPMENPAFDREMGVRLGLDKAAA